MRQSAVGCRRPGTGATATAPGDPGYRTPHTTAIRAAGRAPGGRGRGRILSHTELPAAAGPPMSATIRPVSHGGTTRTGGGRIQGNGVLNHLVLERGCPGTAHQHTVSSYVPGLLELEKLHVRSRLDAAVSCSCTSTSTSSFVVLSPPSATSSLNTPLPPQFMQDGLLSISPMITLSFK